MIVAIWQSQKHTEKEGKVVGWYPLEDESKKAELEADPFVVLVDNIPYPTNGIVPKGKMVEHRISLPEKELYFILVDAPESLEEKLIRLETENESLKQSQAEQDEIIMGIVLGGA